MSQIIQIIKNTLCGKRKNTENMHKLNKKQKEYDIDTMMIKDLRIYNCSSNMDKKEREQKIIIFINYTDNYDCSKEFISELIYTIHSESMVDCICYIDYINFIKTLERKYKYIFHSSEYIETIVDILYQLKRNAYDKLYKNQENRNNFSNIISFMVNLGFRHSQMYNKLIEVCKYKIIDSDQRTFKLINCIIKYNNIDNIDKRKKIDNYIWNVLKYNYWEIV